MISKSRWQIQKSYDTALQVWVGWYYPHFQIPAAPEIRNNIAGKFHPQKVTRFLHKYIVKDKDTFLIQADSSFPNTRVGRS